MLTDNSTSNISDQNLSRDIISEWFNQFISAIRVDKDLMESDVVSEETKKFYTDAITGNVAEMHNYARINITKYFIFNIVEDYIKEMQSFKATPKKLAFDFSEAKILVWAEIADDDDATERALILSEAKANFKYSHNGFFVSSTIVEESDGFKLPPHYQQIQIDGRLSGAHSAG